MLRVCGGFIRTHAGCVGTSATGARLLDGGPPGARLFASSCWWKYNAPSGDGPLIAESRLQRITGHKRSTEPGW
jgi:hypothetical protein